MLTKYLLTCYLYSYKCGNAEAKRINVDKYGENITLVVEGKGNSCSVWMINEHLEFADELE